MIIFQFSHKQHPINNSTKRAGVTFLKLPPPTSYRIFYDNVTKWHFLNILHSQVYNMPITKYSIIVVCAGTNYSSIVTCTHNSNTCTHTNIVILVPIQIA